MLAELAAGRRLLTIVGPSGMGKTRLARQVMSEAAPSFQEAGGVWFCSLAACRGPSDLQATVAGVLGIPQTEGHRLVRAIANRGPMLLVLDNLDHIASEAGAVLGEWFEQCRETQILATSILPIGVDAEIRLELGPLAEEDAVALYLERAHRAQAERSLLEEDQLVISELVACLDRIPLALELAAARVRVLPPRAMLNRMGQRFEVLQSARPGRHGSLLRALSLTWDLLSAEEQRVLCRLSVCEGGFTIEAAAAILEEEEAEVIGVIDQLREKALLQIEEASPLRYSQFESVRAFAALELTLRGEGEETARRHASYFIRNGERHAEKIGGRYAPSSLCWLRAERDNLLAALRQGLADEAATAARAGFALRPLLARDGPPAKELELADQTVAAARQVGDPAWVVRALRCRAWTIIRLGRLNEYADDIEEGLALARAHGLRTEEGELLALRGSMVSRSGDLDAAIPILEGVCSIARREGVPLLEAKALLFLAAAARADSSPDEANRLYQEALLILRREGELHQEGNALNNFAVLLTNQGRFREARRTVKAALRIAHLLESRVLIAGAEVNLGGVELAAGSLDEAERYTRRGLELQREIGNLRMESVARGNLGIIALERGRAEVAEEAFCETIQQLVECGDRRLLATILGYLAVALARQGRLEEARRTMAEARSSFTMGDGGGAAVMELLEGVLELCQGAERSDGNGDLEKLKRHALAKVEAARKLTGTAIEDLFAGIRLLEAEVASLGSGSGCVPGIASEAAAQGGEGETLLVGPACEWFELERGERIDLRRRVAAHRIFVALVEQHAASPGEGLVVEDLFALGWPNERANADSSATRVYNNVRHLRSLGLGELLLRHPSGYLLEPGMRIVRRDG